MPNFPFLFGSESMIDQAQFFVGWGTSSRTQRRQERKGEKLAASFFHQRSISVHQRSWLLPGDPRVSRKGAKSAKGKTGCLVLPSAVHQRPSAVRDPRASGGGTKLPWPIRRSQRIRKFFSYQNRDKISHPGKFGFHQPRRGQKSHRCKRTIHLRAKRSSRTFSPF